MKSLVLVLLSLTTFAQAGVPGSDLFRGRPSIQSVNLEAQKIYDALNVEAVEVNPGIAGSMRLRKAVGGLTCEMSRVVVPNVVTYYNCELANEVEGVNHEAIFEALNVEAVHLNPGFAGKFRVRKVVANLSCTMSELLSSPNGPSTICFLSEVVN